MRASRGHKLLTKEIEKNLPDLYSNEDKKPEQVDVVLKFFCPYSNWTWYVTEGARQENGDVLFFGYVDGLEGELGYFSLNELENAYKGPLPLVERDCYYTPQKLSEVMRKG